MCHQAGVEGSAGPAFSLSRTQGGTEGQTQLTLQSTPEFLAALAEVCQVAHHPLHLTPVAWLIGYLW